MTKKKQAGHKALLHLLFTLLYSLGSPHEHPHCRSEDGWWHPLETWRSWLNPSPGVAQLRKGSHGTMNAKTWENMRKSTAKSLKESKSVFSFLIHLPDLFNFQCACSLQASFSSFCVCSSLSGLGDSIFHRNPVCPSPALHPSESWESYDHLPTLSRRFWASWRLIAPSGR